MLTPVSTTQNRIFVTKTFDDGSCVCSNYNGKHIGNAFSFLVELLSEIEKQKFCSQRVSLLGIKVVPYGRSRIFFIRIDIKGVMTIYIPPKTSVVCRRIFEYCKTIKHSHEQGLAIHDKTAVAVHKISKLFEYEDPTVMFELPQLGINAYLPAKISDIECDDSTIYGTLRNVQELLTNIFPKWTGTLSRLFLSLRLTKFPHGTHFNAYIIAFFQERRISQCMFCDKPISIQPLPKAKVYTKIFVANSSFVLSKNCTFLCLPICIPRIIQRNSCINRTNLITFKDQQIKAFDDVINALWIDYYDSAKETFKCFMRVVAYCTKNTIAHFLSGEIAEMEAQAIFDSTGTRVYVQATESINMITMKMELISAIIKALSDQNPLLPDEVFGDDSEVIVD